MKKTLRLVEVLWADAWTSSGWSDEDNEPGDNEPEMCRSIGMVMHDTKRGITLASAISPSKSKIGFGHKAFVPRGMIVQVREIEKIRVVLEE